jgi:hypothetical protein
MAAEESLVGIPNPEVKFVSRVFEFACPKCGHLFFQPRSVGHHGTVAKKKLQGLFPKADLKRLRSALPLDEVKILRQTLNGKRMASDEEISRWLKVLGDVRQP